MLFKAAAICLAISSMYVCTYVCMYVCVHIYIYVYNRRDDTHGTGDGRDDNAKRILTFAASGLQIRPCLDYFTIHPEITLLYTLNPVSSPNSEPYTLNSKPLSELRLQDAGCGVRRRFRGVPAGLSYAL